MFGQITISTALTIVCASVQAGEDHRSLGGIAVGINRARVEAVLGPPKSALRNDADRRVQLTYDGLMVSLNLKDAVVSVVASNPKHCSAGGICSGASASEAARLLGHPRGTKRLPDGAHYYDEYPHLDGCGYDFQVKSGKVLSIALNECL